MIAPRLAFALVALLLALPCATQVNPEAGKEGYQPTPGQAGKDVVWIPTPDGLVVKMLAAGELFDLIYVDGSHTALAVLIDLCFCASLLSVGGMMVLDDYWHDISEIGGPGALATWCREHSLGLGEDVVADLLGIGDPAERRRARFRRRLLGLHNP